jgi:hypothetical protein
MPEFGHHVSVEVEDGHGLARQELLGEGAE